MGMGTDKNEDGTISDINITPMVDVILVLLVIFMVTANFLKKESININLPQVAAADPNIKESKQIAVTKDGKFYLEGNLVTEQVLLSEMTREAKYRPNMRVTLSADENLSYGSVSKLMGLLRKCGVTRVALSVKR
jgi:biopolymer transport protein ExbD